MSVRNLESLFQPRSVAVIGASDRPGSVGNVVLRNARSGGLTGPVWAVNKNHELVGGEKAWPDVASLPAAPDLAIVCTPAASVPSVIAQLGAKGTRAAIVFAAGLREPAQESGITLEQAMLTAAKPYLLRILGPNCIGALVPGIGLNASFAPGNALAGSLAFVTQSGALATTMLDWANERGIGFSHFISLGDSSDVDFGDVLDYLASDPNTRAILLYVESVKAARKFMSAARAASRNKPVIVVKAGRSPTAAKAAASHTGALAGSDAVFDAAARRAGMLRVDTLEALFDAAGTLAHPHSWRGERVALLTNGGGAGVLAADALALAGGNLAQLSDATMKALDACLPPSWSHGNPVDIVGDAPTQRYSQALDVLLSAQEVDGVIFMHAPTAIVPASDIALECLPHIRNASKLVLSCWMGGNAVAGARSSFSYQGLPWYSTPERAVGAWLQLADYHRNQESLHQVPDDRETGPAPERDRALAIVRRAVDAGHEWLDPEEAHALLRAYGIETAPTRMARTGDEAAQAAVDIGFPVAVKLVSQQIVHKSDVGGVALGLDSSDEVRNTTVRMRQQAARLVPGAQIAGFAVQGMVKRPHGRELIAGIASDPVFGPVLLFGRGGTDVELSKDHAIALPPLNDLLARDLIDRSGVRTMLAAHRGAPAKSEQAVVDALVRLSQMACDLASLAELDINPLVVDAQGAISLDARVRVRLRGTAAGAQLALRPYPQKLEERVTVNSTQLLLRPIRPEDGNRLKAFYAKCSPQDMRLRFFMARREVPTSELARFSQIDYDREMTFIALTPADEFGNQRMAGEVRAVCDPDNIRAEFAIQVASAWQGHGLGRVMMDKLLNYLRARGTTEVIGQCLRENAAMLALARSVGFAVTEGDDGFALRMTLVRDMDQVAAASGGAKSAN
ncbi:bifunctional acetate--CoA ligase family protein/GNAT family N-acetyltransferase [Caenimonas sp. SL110]|uniref:bifunctional acetate--CoA ligase family protein/GNAT family N-acetyltransferase n=1 Tax=Caenimonas sp. SL110 TaxID=1450524 RepID=UPI00065331C7|nr:bifunctional acetate--CoA ligase family protein/GNAT family N-acetyltransferase [Caenimonas sp. SL110]